MRLADAASAPATTTAGRRGRRGVHGRTHNRDFDRAGLAGPAIARCRCDDSEAGDTGGPRRLREGVGATRAGVAAGDDDPTSAHVLLQLERDAGPAWAQRAVDPE